MSKAERLKILLAHKKQGDVVDRGRRRRVVPPSKTGISAMELPGPSMLSTCSRPLGELLYMRTLPDSTT